MCGGLWWIGVGDGGNNNGGDGGNNNGGGNDPEFTHRSSGLTNQVFYKSATTEQTYF